MGIDIDQEIANANARLKAQNTALLIARDGSVLYLRGTFPPRPNSPKNRPYSQRLYLGIHANYDGVRLIEIEAMKIRFLLDAKQFDWRFYLKSPDPPSITSPSTSPPEMTSVTDWIKAFEKDYFKRRQRNDQTLTTWNTEYKLVFKRLPSQATLTPNLIREIILQTPPDTKTRKRFCICLGALAKFAGLEISTKPLAGNYNPKNAKPRDIPDDSLIVKCFYKIDSPAWRWVYGMLATYGLRNHEVFRVDFEAMKNSSICSVLEGKTGARRVWAFHPEWVEEFGLQSVELPAVDLRRSNSALGHEPTQYFHRQKFPFPPYALRHAWAIRTLEYGLDISLASQQMGHSLKVHSDLYHHWISDKQHQRAFEVLLKRPDRPLPPST